MTRFGARDYDAFTGRDADKLKGHPDIKFVLFDEKPDLVNCDFSDEGSKKTREPESPPPHINGTARFSL